MQSIYLITKKLKSILDSSVEKVLIFGLLRPEYDIENY